jgi:hypothetical protein
VGFPAFEIQTVKKQSLINPFSDDIFLDQESDVVVVFLAGVLCLLEARVLRIGHRSSPAEILVQLWKCTPHLPKL